MYENEMNDLKGDHKAEVVILAPFVLLALGAFLKHTTKSLPLPYTVQLLVIGILLGLALKADTWDDTLQESIEMMGNMDPHLMLHIFLPPLIFESAASLEWHLFAQYKWYILTLAGPGLLAISTLTGFVLKILLDQSEHFLDDLLTSNCPDAWSVQAGIMLGVIMSATDPVAVVALLRELGCKSSLATVIEGESLLNDGTALVLFTILVKIVEGDDSDGVADYFFTFVKMSIGGALFGTSFGFIVVNWIRVIFNDALAEITITLSAAYLCFFIAEYFLHISGVISVVCLGLYFGNKGRIAISPEVAHFLEEFWEILAFCGNTLIFFVAGTVIGLKLPKVPIDDFIQVLIMYFACTMVRSLVIGGIYFLFNMFGAQLQRRDQIITIWAGLRGAVGLSLAMMVFGNSNICGPIRDVVMFHTAGIVFLTVCINSMTLPKLVSCLRLDTVAPSKQLIYLQAMNTLMAAAEKQERNIRSDRIFDSTVWEKARKYYFKVDIDNTLDHIEISERNRETRRRVLMITKQSYWRQFKDGLLSDQSVKFLVHYTDVAIDNDCLLNEWDSYAKLVNISSTFDRGTDKLVASENSSRSERIRLRLLSFLDSIPVMMVILALVFVSCTLTFTLNDNSMEYLIIEHTATSIFCLELLARLYCLQNWQPLAIDPYIAIDIVVVALDLMLLSAEDMLGGFSKYSKSIRSVRFLRLFRLLRLARVAKIFKKAKVAAMNEPMSMLTATAENWIRKYQRTILFSQLRHGYEIATGFKAAREEVLVSIRHIQKSEDDIKLIKDCIEQDLKEVRRALLDAQRLYSEISASITTAVAARTVLNRQRHSIQDLYHEGLLDINEYQKLKGSVEYQMKKLLHHPPLITMPNKKDILSQIPWLECVSSDELSEISSFFEDFVFQRGDILVKQDEPSDSVHVLARGSVVVTYETESGKHIEIEELGIGSVFGEIAWALKGKRGASIIASSPGLLFTINSSSLRHIAGANEQLETKLWETCGRRLSENMLSMQYGKSRRQIREMTLEMHLHKVDPIKKKIWFLGDTWVIILRGVAIVKDDESNKSVVFEAPDILRSLQGDQVCYLVEFSTDARFMCQPSALQSDVGNRRTGRKLKAVEGLVQL